MTTKRTAITVLCLGLLLGCRRPPAALPVTPAADRRDLPDALELRCGAAPQPAVIDLGLRHPPSLDKPDPREPFRDPVFGSCVVRITDSRRDTPSPGLKNVYARVQVFNSDGTRLLIYGTDGAWYLYDAVTFEPLGEVPLEAEPRWDPIHPDRLTYVDGTKLMAYDLGLEAAEEIRDFAGDVPKGAVAAWTAHEGRPSLDGRFFGLMAEDEDWVPVAFLVYDRQADQVTVRDMRQVSGIDEDVDHVTISPKGTTFLASFDRACAVGQRGTEAYPCGLMAYEPDLTNGRGLLRIVGHYDVALDREGREVVVYQDLDTDYISVVDLATAAVIPLWPIDFSHTPLGFHFSGLAYDKPGWALVSTYSGGYPKAYTWMDDQVFALELIAGGRVVRLAHTHSKVNPHRDHDYWAEPHATVNRNFTRVVFTSNWGRSGTDVVDTYMLLLPDDGNLGLPR
ncbi:MAG: hypothetical protein JXC32_03900 [Anaerolineae bacterium]|nr:hypothetical protein [Anaerolineae bacterium]